MTMAGSVESAARPDRQGRERGEREYSQKSPRSGHSSGGTEKKCGLGRMKGKKGAGLLRCGPGDEQGQRKTMDERYALLAIQQLAAALAMTDAMQVREKEGDGGGEEAAAQGM